MPSDDRDPQVPLKDEPLFDGSSSEQWNQPPSRRRLKLTSTGAIWLLVPWYFAFSKRLQASLLDFLIFMVAWGSTSGALLRMGLNEHFQTSQIILNVYLCLHVVLLFWTNILYNEKRNANWWRGVHYSTATLELLVLGPWTVIIHLVCAIHNAR